MTELIIDESNFHEHFFEVNRNHKPQRGQTMAKYTAIVEFVDGNLKRDILNLLVNTQKAQECTILLRKLGGAVEGDALRVCREMAEDLHSGMSVEEVAKKIYKYTFEQFYWTKPENVPDDDPHWSLIEMKNLDQFIEAEKGTVIEAKISTSEELEIPEGS